MAVLKYKSNGTIKTLGITESGASSVTSVNGKTGAVTGLYDQNNQPPYPVKSVNGNTGEVEGWKFFTNQPFKNLQSSLPSGNTTSFYLDFVFDGDVSHRADGIIFRFDAFPLLWNVKPLSGTRVLVMFYNPGGIPDNPSVPLRDIWMRCFSTGKGVIKSVTYSEE